MDSNKLSTLAVVPISKTNQESVPLPSEIATNAYDTEPSTAILEVTESNVTPNPPTEAPHPFLLTPPTNDDSSRSPSVHNAVLARRNLLSHIRDNYRTISRTNRILLITNFVFSFSMVTAMIVVLIVTRNQDCDRPLRSFLALNVFKYGFGIPLMLVHYLHPDGRFPQYSSSVWVQWADR
ncbi:hypothetical protein K7432_003628 [Basidiobolus ranarum]|uniref:Uncharacterized protein n=1 Tax=Basidiobolus ranarum TaxID=34480 RepID=A0ABR2WZK2_9FUNG